MVRRLIRMTGKSLLVVTCLVLAGCGADPFAPGGEPAAVASVTCEAERTTVDVNEVRAEPTGVHLRVDNLTGRDQLLFYGVGGEVLNRSIGSTGPSELVVASPPGDWRVLCSRPEIYPDDSAPWVTLTVTDPDHLWVEAKPDCPTPSGTHPDYIEYFEGGTPTGQPGDPVELARQQLPQHISLPANFTLEAAGYPQESPRRVRLVVDSRVAAVATFRPDENGGWFFGDVLYCDDLL